VKLTTVSLKHKIYRALDVLSKFDNQLILDEFNNNEWIFNKIEPNKDLSSYPIRGKLNTRNCSSDGLNIIGHNYQLIRIATDIKYKLQRLLIDKPLVLNRINTNIQYFGMESSFHVDSKEKNCWSFVYFVGPQWNTSWGGEFCAYTGNTDYQHVSYIPNTAVLFPAHLEHMGYAPNRLSNKPRLSVAFVYHEL